MSTAGQVRAGAARRNQVLTAAALALTATGIVLATLQPAWLTEPLRAAVDQAGPAAPLVFVLLCVLAAPAHLSGVLIALSLLVWPLPVAAALSFAGGVAGCLLTAALLALAGAGPARQRDGWPAWLERFANRVARRPLLVGIGVRFVLQSGIAVEAFYLLTGYTRRQYLLVTAVGFALYVAQTVLGITAVAALIEISPWLGVLLVLVPVAAAGALVALRRRQRARTGEASSNQNDS